MAVSALAPRLELDGVRTPCSKLTLLLRVCAPTFAYSVTSGEEKDTALPLSPSAEALRWMGLSGFQVVDL